MRQLTFFLGLVFNLVLTTGAAAQGSWQPAGATADFPRTLLKASDLAAVRASLDAPATYSLFSSLYGSAFLQLGTANSTSGQRHDRSNLAKNAAFVLLLDRKPAGGSTAQLDPAERDTLQNRARRLLETSNTVVEPFATWTNFTSYDEWQWRSKELIDYLIAYDLLRGAGVPAATLAVAQARLQLFAGNLYQQSMTSFLGISFYSQVKNNHTLMTAAALGMAAVVLNDVGSASAYQQPSKWISAGLYNIDNVLWQDSQRQSDAGAVTGYAEGPYYFKYAFLNCLPFFRAMGNFLPDSSLSYTFGSSTRSIRNPYYDPRYDLLYDWVTAIRLPDGRLPALEDSYVDMAMPELALTGKRRYLKPLYLSRLAPGQLGSLAAQLSGTTVDMRAAYLAANLTPTAPSNPALTALPASGNLIFRAGSDSLASYLHVYGKDGLVRLNGGGHSHGDASSFLLHANGQLLALDAGYLSYSRRSEVGQAANHNLVLVDGAGPAIGSAGGSKSGPSTVQNSFQTDQLSYGEVQSTYQNAGITRKVLHVRGSYFLLADFVTASSAHTYTWQLHGYGLENGTASTGTFADSLASHEGRWQKNGAGLLAHVTATGGASTYAKATRPHELTYNTVENHTTLLVGKAGSASTQFLAALAPYTTAAPTFETTSTSGTAGLSSAGADYQDVAFAQADTVLSSSQSPSLPQPVSSDARLTFYSVEASSGQLAQLFLDQGRELRYGSSLVLQASQRATISYQRRADGSYGGYVSRATTLTLPADAAPLSVTGASSFRYDSLARQLSLVFTQPGSFVLSMASPTPLPVELVRFSGQCAGSSVRLSWTTASEQQNAGFAVQRRTGTEAGFTHIGFVPGAGNAQGPRQYTFTDASAASGLSYYRLQQRDLDGKLSYSPVVSVNRQGCAGASLLVYPVPAREEITLAFADADTELRWQLCTLQGQVVRQGRFRQQAQVDVRGLARGLYVLQAEDAAGTLLAKGTKVILVP